MLSVTEVHEAGHLLMARRLGVPVLSVGFGLDYAEVELDASGASDDAVRLILAAGAAAELAVYGDILSTCQQLRADLDPCYWRQWPAFEKAARNLATHMTLDEIEQTWQNKPKPRVC